MFKDANKIARGFTRSMIMSRVNIAGKCSAGIGAFVVINDEGWIVTAAHNLTQLLELDAQEKAYEAHVAKEASIRGDTTLHEKERRKQLQSLGKLKGEDTAHASAWLGGVGTGLANINRIEAVDLGVAQLTGFDPTKIADYPKFKSAGPEFLPGTSLCKLGFPFYEGVPSWDATTKSFSFPPGALDACCFPMDGIFTRTLEVQPVDPAGNPIPNPFPLEFLETSTPGLKGQSGGPIFDVHGHVWALQCRTSHMALGFSPIVEINGVKTVEHQFINLGSGPSSRTLMGALSNLGVKFRVAP